MLIKSPMKMQVVDAGTGDVIEELHNVGGLMPPAKDRCQICATKHEPELPHNRDSLFYQMAFNGEHGRWPTWADAMAHCSDDMRAAWTAELQTHGVDVNPAPPPPEPEQPKCLAPENALYPPGTDIDLSSTSDDAIKRVPAKIIAVAPPRAPIEFAVADQLGKPRPWSFTPNRRRSNTYVIEYIDEHGDPVRLFVPEKKLKAGIQPEPQQNGTDDPATAEDRS